MNKLITLVALILVVSLNAFAQSKPNVVSLSDATAIASLPKFVQEMTKVHTEVIENIDYTYKWQYDVVAWGTGTYRLTDGHEIPFEWVSFKNDDDWLQVKMNARIYGFDLAPVRRISDTLNRKIYDTKVENQNYWTTWIGTSNDWGFGPEMYTDGQSGLISQFLDKKNCVDMVAVTRYYLAKVSVATPALRFEVKGRFACK